MKPLIISVVLIAWCYSLNAQPVASPEATLFFSMQQAGGANGIAVAYNSKQNIYYAAMAGNADYPLECFSGEHTIHEGAVGFDARGLWFNEKSNALEGNSYQKGGIYVISVDGKGIPYASASNKYHGSQPDDQSVGAYDESTEEILYFDYVTGTVSRYKKTSDKPGKVIKLKDCPASFEDLNSACIYTGQKDYEMGFYDFVEAKVYLFNKKGEFQQAILLPEDAPYSESFNFSYANGYVFLFDKDMREWYGYKIF